MSEKHLNIMNDIYINKIILLGRVWVLVLCSQDDYKKHYIFNNRCVVNMFLSNLTRRCLNWCWNRTAPLLVFVFPGQVVCFNVFSFFFPFTTFNPVIYVAAVCWHCCISWVFLVADFREHVVTLACVWSQFLVCQSCRNGCGSWIVTEVNDKCLEANLVIKG